MAQNDLGAGAGGVDLGPWPVGSSGWTAGDFQNGAGLLGIAPPVDDGFGASAFGGAPTAPTPVGSGGVNFTGAFPLGGSGWLAGDFQNGSGLLGVTSPIGAGAYANFAGQGAPGTGWTPWTPGSGPGLLPLASPAPDGSQPSNDPQSGGPALDDTDSEAQPSDGAGSAEYETDDDGPQDEPSDPQDDALHASQGGAHIDYGLATPGEAQFEPVSDPRPYRRYWEKQKGMPYPKTEDGRNFHRHHIKPMADGGADTFENMEPMHPDEHRAHHMANGDFSRWAKRRWPSRGAAADPEAGFPPYPRLVRPYPQSSEDPEHRLPRLLQIEPGGTSGILPVPEIEPGETDDD